MNPELRAQLQREYEEVKEKVRKNPGQKLADPRFKGDEPAYIPEAKALVAYFEENWSGYEFFGPRIGPSMANDPSTTDRNEVFIEADLTGNGLTDYVAVIRSKHHSDIARIVAFLQESEEQFCSVVIRTVASRYTSYVYILTVGEIREKAKRWIDEHRTAPPPVMTDKSIPDDRFAFTTNEPFRHTKGWIYAGGYFWEVACSC